MGRVGLWDVWLEGRLGQGAVRVIQGAGGDLDGGSGSGTFSISFMIEDHAAPIRNRISVRIGDSKK